MKKIFLIILLVATYNSLFAQSTEFVNMPRKSILESFSKNNDVFLAKTGFSMEGQFDVFQSKNSDHLILCFYDENNVCVANKEAWSVKETNTVLDDLNNKFTKLNGAHWINKDNTMNIDVQSDKKYITVLYAKN